MQNELKQSQNWQIYGEEIETKLIFKFLEKSLINRAGSERRN